MNGLGGYLLLFVVLFAAAMAALWIAPPFGSFALSDT